MDKQFDRVAEEALSLDRASKLMLAEMILSETDQEPKYKEEWSKEIHRRIDEIRLGHAQMYDAFEMIHETREQLGL